MGIKNCPIRIETKCDVCGKVVSIHPSVYKKNKHQFCSKECYHSYRNEHVPRGEESPFYNRIDAICDNCGKPIKIIPFHYNKKNKYGESHNFCSHECYSEFRSKYYVGEKSTMANYVFTDE